MSGIVIEKIETPYDPVPIKKAMRQNEITIRDLASQTGIHYVTISRILAGTRVDSQTIAKVCSHLSIPVPTA